MLLFLIVKYMDVIIVNTCNKINHCSTLVMARTIQPHTRHKYATESH